MPPSRSGRLRRATGAEVELREVDLTSFASVRAFTDAVAADHDRLDVLIANAGVMACPEGRTADGFELQFGTNHLGHFLLVNRLRPLLPTGEDARIINLSSAGHRFSDVVLDDINFEQTPYDPWVAYGRSKSANVLFTVELDRRGRDAGQRSAAVHPGAIMTALEPSHHRGDARHARKRRAPAASCTGRRSSRVRPPASGPGSWPMPARSAAATARTAASARPPTTPPAPPACSPTRSTPPPPRRCGPGPRSSSGSRSPT